MHLAAGGNLGYIRKAIIDPAAEELRMLPQDLMAKAHGPTTTTISWPA